MPSERDPRRHSGSPLPPGNTSLLLDCAGLTYSRGTGDQTFRVEIGGLELAPGETVALTGESGCGKSTALELLGLVVRPQAAERFLFAGSGEPEDLAEIWRLDGQRQLAQLRAASIGFVLQTGGLLPYLSVADNIVLNRRLLRLPDRDSEVDATVEQLKLGPLLRKKPAQLSIGQYQRASIARALAHRPRLLLADEPTSALDPRLGDEVVSMLLDVAGRLGTGVVLATHEQALVRALGLREVRAEPLADALGSRFAE